MECRISRWHMATRLQCCWDPIRQTPRARSISSEDDNARRWRVILSVLATIAFSGSSAAEPYCAEPTPTPTVDECAGVCDGRRCTALCPRGSLDPAGSCAPTEHGCACVPFECLAETYCYIPE